MGNFVIGRHRIGRLAGVLLPGFCAWSSAIAPRPSNRIRRGSNRFGMVGYN